MVHRERQALVEHVALFFDQCQKIMNAVHLNGLLAKTPFSGKNVQMLWPAQLEWQDDQVNLIHYTIHECHGINGYNTVVCNCYIVTLHVVTGNK